MAHAVVSPVSPVTLVLPAKAPALQIGREFAYESPPGDNLTDHVAALLVLPAEQASPVKVPEQAMPPEPVNGKSWVSLPRQIPEFPPVDPAAGLLDYPALLA